MAEEDDQTSDHKGGNQCQKRTLLGALTDTVQLFGTNVLSCKGSKRHTKGEIRKHDEPIHTHDDDVCRNDGLAEAVGQRLNNDHSRREDHLGKTGRKTEFQGRSGVFLFQLQIFHFHIEYLTHFHQLDEA